MAKFNQTKVSAKKTAIAKAMPVPEMVNKAGGRAYKAGAELELAIRLLNMFCTSTYYDTAQQSLQGLIDVVPRLKDPIFAAKAAILARTEFGMRSGTHALTCELARALHNNGMKVTWFRPFVRRVVDRVDDMTEIMAYWNSLDEPGTPNALKRGLRDAFDKFDTYQLGKYRSENGAVKLVDVVRIVHPVPVEKKNATGLAKLIKGTLRAIGRHVGLTKAGQTAKTVEEKKELKAAVLKETVADRKTGYFELLKNLGGILRDAPAELDAALKRIVDPNEIKGSRVMPFRYLDAYRAIEALYGSDTNHRKVLKALSQALDISCSNIPILGRTLVAVDVSDSMTAAVRASKEDIERNTRRGTQVLSRKDAAALFGALVVRAGLGDLMMFASNAAYVKYNPADSAISIAKEVSKNRGCGGHGTNFHEIFNTALGQKYDRIVIFSDMQGWMPDRQAFVSDPFAGRFVQCPTSGAPTTSFARYAEKHGIPWVYSCNLDAHGELMFPEKGAKVVTIAGYSEKMFEMMALGEQDPHVLVNKINAVSLT